MLPQLDKRQIRYLEYGLLAVIVGIVGIFILDKVSALHKEAERQVLLGQINAMRGRVVATLKNSQLPENIAQKKEARNPVRILHEDPQDYLGEIANPEKVKIPAGSWYFDTQAGALVYKAKFEHKFPFTFKPRKQIRLALMTLEQAEKKKMRNILTCGPKICILYLSQN